MNILYCGDSNIEDGLLISILSLCKNVPEPLHIYVLTMSVQTQTRRFLPVSETYIQYIRNILRKKNPQHQIVLLDLTESFASELPRANLQTRFTPYCMLRLFADMHAELPDRLLYLDTDVICRRDCREFYHQALNGTAFIGVLDYYGRWFFRKKPWKSDYINSGVLLLNLKYIRETGLFANCRSLCAGTRMFMPDQSALNKLADTKRIAPRRYNEQRRLKKDTVFQHFSTSFRLFPWFHTLTVKPWQIEEVHETLKLHEYDDILSEYNSLKKQYAGG